MFPWQWIRAQQHRNCCRHHNNARVSTTWRVVWLPESWDSKIWSWIQQDSESRMTVQARAISTLSDWKCQGVCMTPRVVRQNTMAMSPTGPGTKNVYSSEGQLQFTQTKSKPELLGTEILWRGPVVKAKLWVYEDIANWKCIKSAIVICRLSSN
jgi:hypothetical protein